MQLEKEIYTTKFDSEVHKATINLMFTAHWVRTRLGAQFKLFGLTPEQYNVMRILKGKYPEKMCVKDIGKRMIEKNSNVPRILDRLVRKELVIRQQSELDRRETETTLSQKGLDLLATVTDHIKEQEKNIMQLDEATAAQLNTILENVRNI
jgi:DNA-binding MarR family transcriptional regulator